MDVFEQVFNRLRGIIALRYLYHTNFFRNSDFSFLANFHWKSLSVWTILE